MRISHWLLNLELHEYFITASSTQQEWAASADSRCPLSREVTPHFQL